MGADDHKYKEFPILIYHPLGILSKIKVNFPADRFQKAGKYFKKTLKSIP